MVFAPVEKCGLIGQSRVAAPSASSSIVQSVVEVRVLPACMLPALTIRAFGTMFG
jgi:hypothetical protein